MRLIKCVLFRIVPMVLFLFAGSVGALTEITIPSSSPAQPPPQIRALASAQAINPDNIITFSEFPQGTIITTQYANRGIVFGGDSPFISGDGSNPTSPVLSGTPQFQGAIEGRFVDPKDGTTPTTVGGFSLDGGYFDALGSVRLLWYGPDGSQIGQKIATMIGIETFTVEGGAIARWRIETIKDEPAGFAIDNVSIKPTDTALMFREQGKDGGFWGRLANYIPGFDHSALLVDNLVYESNVLHDLGTYVDKDGTEEVINDNSAPAMDDGVQYFHTKGTFEWDALKGESSAVSQTATVPISRSLAERMEEYILQKKDSPFYLLPYFLGLPIVTELVPEKQKGENSTGGVTCVGLLEWAAEMAGHRGGKGFIDNQFESAYVRLTGNFAFAWPPISVKLTRIGLLSPELLFQSTSGVIARTAQAAEDIKEWIQGYFDPVDFIITDPLGRRLGHSEATGTLREIPGAFYSGDGDWEQFLILGTVPGLYKIEVFGLGKVANFGIASEKHGVGMESFYLANGEKRIMYFVKEVVPGGVGDVDGDGDVDADDVATLEGMIPQFTAGLNDPRDLNGDGILDNSDLALLQQLTEVVNTPYPQPPVSIPTVSVWGLALLGLILPGLAVFARRRV